MRLPTAEEIERQTPPDRNRLADALRVGALGIVVVGHWFISAVWVEGGEPMATSLLTEPSVQVATWFFQVMPLFFVVGGYANARSWSRHRESSESAADWLVRRTKRLLAPALVVVLFWALLAPVLPMVFAVEADIAGMAAFNALVPLWFLAVYVVIIALVPLTEPAHRRLGLAVPVIGTIAVVVLDLTTLTDIAAFDGLAYVLVWGVLHQFGYFWADDRCPGVTGSFLLLGGGLAAIAIGLLALDYPSTMVGDQDSNTDPPTVLVLALGAVQVGILLPLRDRLHRGLERPRAYAAVALGGTMAMPLYIWHMTAMILAGIAAWGLGLLPSTTPAPWEPVRILWIAGCALAMIPVLATIGRLGTRTVAWSVSSLPGVILGIALTHVGLRVVLEQGVLADGVPQPLGPGLMLAGCALIGALPARRG